MRSAARVGIVGALVAAVVSAGSTVGATSDNNGRGRLAAIDHLVVIYEENHSFDNRFGSWPGVDGLNKKPGNTPRNTQVDTTGTQLQCLLQFDVNLTSPPAHRQPVHAARRLHRAERVRQPAVQHRRRHRGDRHDVPDSGAGLQLPERHPEGTGPVRWLHP